MLNFDDFTKMYAPIAKANAYIKKTYDDQTSAANALYDTLREEGNEDSLREVENYMNSLAMASDNLTKRGRMNKNDYDYLSGLRSGADNVSRIAGAVAKKHDLISQFDKARANSVDVRFVVDPHTHSIDFLRNNPSTALSRSIDLKEVHRIAESNFGALNKELHYYNIAPLDFKESAVAKAAYNEAYNNAVAAGKTEAEAKAYAETERDKEAAVMARLFKKHGHSSRSVQDTLRMIDEDQEATDIYQRMLQREYRDLLSRFGVHEFDADTQNEILGAIKSEATHAIGADDVLLMNLPSAGGGRGRGGAGAKPTYVKKAPVYTEKFAVAADDSLLKESEKALQDLKEDYTTEDGKFDYAKYKEKLDTFKAQGYLKDDLTFWEFMTYIGSGEMFYDVYSMYSFVQLDKKVQNLIKSRGIKLEDVTPADIDKIIAELRMSKGALQAEGLRYNLSDDAKKRMLDSFMADDQNARSANGSTANETVLGVTVPIAVKNATGNIQVSHTPVTRHQFQKLKEKLQSSSGNVSVLGSPVTTAEGKVYVTVVADGSVFTLDITNRHNLQKDAYGIDAELMAAVRSYNSLINEFNAELIKDNPNPVVLQNMMNTIGKYENVIHTKWNVMDRNMSALFTTYLKDNAIDAAPKVDKVQVPSTETKTEEGQQQNK